MKTFLSIAFVVCAVCSGWSATEEKGNPEEGYRGAVIPRGDGWDEWAEKYGEQTAGKGSKEYYKVSSLSKDGQSHGGKKKKKPRCVSMSDLPNETTQ